MMRVIGRLDNNRMQIFLVGGAVRDALLDREVTERDWVVVGATPGEMLARGFRPVGAEFPVFLHPETGEEYALARTERKTGHGYHGFEMQASPDVTLEEDLQRRDLTINAMARDDEDNIIDPWGGLADLEARRLRHVSPAFAEDPLRVLRVARFAARYHPLGFRVAEETRSLMKKLVDDGEVAHLTPERIWKETSRALMEAAPEVFFRELEDCGALAVLFPELAALRGVPQPPQHHPEVDTLEHQYLVLQQAARLELPLPARWAVLMHDLGKGVTPPEQWPRHIAHERRSARLAARVSDRLKVPRDCKEIALLVAEHHTLCHTALDLRPKTLWKLLHALDVVRRPERLELFVGACEADARGRTGLEDRPYPQATYLREAARAATSIDITPLREKGLQGPELGQAIERLRLATLGEFRQQWKQNESP